MVLVFMSDNIVTLHIKYKSVKSFINDVLSNEPLLLRFDKKFPVTMCLHCEIILTLWWQNEKIKSKILFQNYLHYCHTPINNGNKSNVLWWQRLLINPLSKTQSTFLSA